MAMAEEEVEEEEGGHWEPCAAGSSASWSSPTGTWSGPRTLTLPITPSPSAALMASSSHYSVSRIPPLVLFPPSMARSHRFDPFVLDVSCAQFGPVSNLLSTCIKAMGLCFLFLFKIRRLHRFDPLIWTNNIFARELCFWLPSYAS